MIILTPRAAAPRRRSRTRRAAVATVIAAFAFAALLSPAAATTPRWRALIEHYGTRALHPDVVARAQEIARGQPSSEGGIDMGQTGIRLGRSGRPALLKLFADGTPAEMVLHHAEKGGKIITGGAAPRRDDEREFVRTRFGITSHYPADSLGYTPGRFEKFRPDEAHGLNWLSTVIVNSAAGVHVARVKVPTTEGVSMAEHPPIDEVAIKIDGHAGAGYYVPRPPSFDQPPPRHSASSVGIALLRSNKGAVKLRYASGNGLSFLVQDIEAPTVSANLRQRVILPKSGQPLDRHTIFDLAELVATAVGNES